MMSSELAEMEDLLRGVTRSFYLTLRILPRSIRPQISLAYLLARATDTIADTRLIPVDLRLKALHRTLEAIRRASEGRSTLLSGFADTAAARPPMVSEGSLAEWALLENLDKLLQVLQRFSSDDRLLVREVIETIARGQEMDLIRFGSASEDHIVAIETDEELDDYTYCVAGCAGEFWTKMCRAHVLSKEALDDAFLLANGVRFGKGLQLVNILRDLPRDLRQGRCYIPVKRLNRCGLKPTDLLDSTAMARFRAIYDGYLQVAEDHLSAGWAYTRMLPPVQIRMRLACSWPALIGIRTLARLRSENVLDRRQIIKISRSEVRRLIIRSIVLCPRPSSWNRLFDLAREG